MHYDSTLHSGVHSGVHTILADYNITGPAYRSDVCNMSLKKHTNTGGSWLELRKYLHINLTQIPKYMM